MQVQPTFISKRNIGIVVSILWILFSIALLCWELVSQREKIHELAAVEARASFNKDLVYRRWSANHGGTYVPITESTPPTPFLEHIEERDIQTPSGKKLTLVNPAYMTRQVHEMGEEQYGVKGHITSLKPLRTENKPDEWERKALNSFEGGFQEMIEVSSIEGVPHLRLMRPMTVEKGCLKCHGYQGYEIGDVRGGISVSVPLTKYNQIMKGDMKRHIIIYLIILVSGLCIIVASFYLLNQVEKSRNRVMEEIEKQEAHLRTIFSAADNVAFVTTDFAGAQTKVRDFSPGAEKIFGYNRSEIVGEEVAKLHLPGASKDFFEIQQKLQDGEKGFSGETMLVRKSGEHFPVLLTIHPIKNVEGEVIGTVGVTIDISIRRKAETALKESEENARALLNSITESAFLIDKHGHFVLANEITSKRLGLEIHLEGKCAYDYLPKDIAESRRKRVNRLLREKQPQQFIDKRDGMYLDQKISPVLNDAGEVRHIAVFARDITMEKRAEEALYRDLMMNRAIAEISQEILAEKYELPNVAALTLYHLKELTKSEHGFVSSIDKTTLENVGHSFSEMFGESCSLESGNMTFPVGDDGQYNGLWGYALNTKKSFFTNDPGNHPASTGIPNGHIPLKNYLAVPVIGGDNLLGLLALANSSDGYDDRDITQVERIAEVFALALHLYDYELQRFEMEENIQQLQKTEAIGALAGGIAHDFNNILSPIIGYAEILEEDIPAGNELHEYVQKIHISAMRAKELVKQILTYSRQHKKEIKPIKPHLVIQEVVQLIKATLPATIEVHHTIDKNTKTILADHTQIHQVAMNLCTNAYHAMHEVGGVLEVKLKNKEVHYRDHSRLKTGTYIVLTVEDSGIGMDKSTMQRIFDPYFTTKPKEKGTGLGLSLVYGIVKSYEGEIEVESEVGKGTIFTIYLPAYNVLDTRTDLTENKTAPKGNEAILLVDDDSALLQMTMAILKRLGYEVDGAGSGKDALDKIRSHPDKYDLLITDMTMPKMTGDILTIEAKKLRKDMPVIICTGFSELISHEKAREIGADGFLMKPVSKLDIASVVREVLDSNN